MAANPEFVRNMLRSDAELGDVAQFNPNPMHKQYSSLKGSVGGHSPGKLVPTRSRSSPTSSSLGNVHRHRGPHLNTTGTSPGASSLINPRPTPDQRSLPGSYPTEEYPTWSITQSSYKSHAPSNRPSNQHAGYQTRLIDQTGRPRSPFAYPTRLRRPGYRPSSPALSDFYQNGSASRTTSRPNSPASIRSMNQPPNSWKQEVSSPDQISQHYHAHRTSAYPEHQYLPLPTSQSSNLPLNPNERSVSGRPTVLANQRSLSNLRHQAESPPASPGFYDYSEVFESAQHPAFTQQRTVDQPQLGQDKSMPKSSGSKSASSAPFEQHLDGSRRPFDQLKSIFQEPSMASLGQSSVNQEYTGLPKSDFQAFDTRPKPNTAAAVDDSKGSIQRESGSKDSTNTGSEGSRATPREDDESQVPLKVSGQRTRKAGMSERTTAFESSLSPSSTASKPSAESYLPPRPAPRSSYSGSSSGPLPLNTTAPKLDSSGKTRTKVEKASEAVSMMSDEFSFSEPTEIVSPTPERSVTSPTTRHRFSKILGVQDSISPSQGQSIPPRAPSPPTDIHDKSFFQSRISRANSTTINTSILSESAWSETDESKPIRTEASGAQAQVETQTSYTANTENAKTKVDQAILPEENDIDGTLQSKRARTQLPTKSNAPKSSVPDAQSGSAVPDTLIMQGQVPIRSSPSSSAVLVNVEVPQVPGKHDTAIASALPKFPSQDSGENSPSLSLRTPSLALSRAAPAEAAIQSPSVVGISKLVDRGSLTSSHGSRPWNRDSTYPWIDESFDLDVALPEKERRTPSPVNKFPRFKLRVHRASTSTTGTSRLTKRRISSDETTSSRRQSGQYFPQVSVFRLRGKPKQSAGPGQDNSSHDIGNQALQSRFVESFDLPPQLHTEIPQPTILLPPSPGHEVRSFFSDDSSQIEQRGSLRKRISHFRARHSQTNLADVGRVHERGVLGSPLSKMGISGRTSRQSQDTVGATSQASNVKRVGAAILQKVRFWWHQNVRKITPRRRYGRNHNQTSLENGNHGP